LKINNNCMKKVLYVVLGVIMITSCTDNQRARSWGGTEEVSLKKNEVLMNITWKGDDMWVLTKDTTTGECHFREHSSFGIIEGEIVLK